MCVFSMGTAIILVVRFLSKNFTSQFSFLIKVKYLSKISNLKYIIFILSLNPKLTNTIYTMQFLTEIENKNILSFYKYLPFQSDICQGSVQRNHIARE